MPIQPEGYTGFDGSPSFANPWVMYDPEKVVLTGTVTASSDTYNALVLLSAETTTINVGALENPGPAVAMAKAIVGFKTDDDSMIQDCLDMLFAGVNTEFVGAGGGDDTKIITWARNMQGVVAAWDLVSRGIDAEYLSTPIAISASDANAFNEWLVQMYDYSYEATGGRSLKRAAEERPQNIGSHARASVAALAVHFQDSTWLDAMARSHAAWAGDNTQAQYNKLSWNSNQHFQSNHGSPFYGIVPRGHFFSGNPLWTASGCQPEEARRDADRSGGGCYGATFHWNPPDTDYYWEGLQGAVVCAHILASHGYGHVWAWSHAALRRAFLFNLDIPRACTAAGGQDAGDTAGITPEDLHTATARVINGKYHAGRDADIPSTFTAMRSMSGLDWYYGL